MQPMPRLPIVILFASAACGGHSSPVVRVPENHQPSACTAATIDRSRGDAVKTASWIEAWQKLRVDPDADVSDRPAPPRDEADAKAKLCGTDGCAGPAQWLFSDFDVDEDTPTQIDVAFPAGAGLLVYPKVGEGEPGRCPWTDDVEITPGAPIQVSVHHLFNDMVDQEGGGEECFYSEAANEDLFFDRDGTLLLHVHRDGHAPADEVDDGGEVELANDDFQFDVSLAVTGRTVTLKGAGCDQTIDL